MKKILVCIFIAILCIVAFEVLKEFTQKQEVENVGNVIVNEEEEKSKEIFAKYMDEAKEKMETLTLDEKIGQLFLVRYPGTIASEELAKYHFGGLLLFEKDFKDKTEEEVKTEIANLQNQVKIKLLIGVDEEGGTVVRVSSNKNLANERFKSPMELYKAGGFDLIKEDTIQKSNLLYNLGINLNLAPVVDISTNSNDYIYQRTLGEGAENTSIYAKTVIEASKDGKVSYVLKHFPGYGNNLDTHTGISVDNRSYDEIINHDLLPFKEGIEAGAEAVLVNHNIVKSIDGENPASLSKEIHRILREELGFTGIIITDDLEMKAIKDDVNATKKAILAGNDIMIVTDYKISIEAVKNAINAGEITEDIINDRVQRILAWKYYKNLV